MSDCIDLTTVKVCVGHTWKVVSFLLPAGSKVLAGSKGYDDASQMCVWLEVLAVSSAPVSERWEYLELVQSRMVGTTFRDVGTGWEVISLHSNYGETSGHAIVRKIG